MTPNGFHMLLAFLLFAALAWGFYVRPRWRHWLFTTLMVHVVAERGPDFVIGGKDRPYMRRWWIIPRNPVFNIYLHNVLRDDDDRALHDHPWFNCSVVLRGGYWEETPQGRYFRHPGAILFRSPWTRHRLELERHYDPAVVDYQDGMPVGEAIPAWTLFITGPKIRTWGFWCPLANGLKRFVPWFKFVDPKDTGAIGPGCDQPDEVRR